MRDTLIIIPASGMREYTELAVESVRRSTDCASMVIVEADPSTEWRDGEDLSAVRLGEFRSFSDSVNRGIEFAMPGGGFRYVVALNNDTAPAAGWLDPLKAAVDDGFCAAGPVTNSCGHGEQVACPPFACSEPRSLDRAALDGFARTLEAGRTPVFAVVGMCMAFRAELLARVGLFDRRFLVGNFEDNDWCLRAGELSPKACCVCRDSFVWHFGSVTFRGSGQFSEAMESNRARFERKWLGKGSTPRRHGNAMFRAPRLPLRLPPLSGPAACPELESVRSEMRARGLEVTEEGGVSVPIDAAAVPPPRTDGFYEFCDAVEASAVEAMSELRSLGKPDVSVCMIVKDEESVLGRCLDSVSPLARQLVVVDTGSTDATVAIAERHGAEVHHYAGGGAFDFSSARNYSLSKARCSWVLVVDADECLLPAGAAAIEATVGSGQEAAYMISTRLYQDDPKVEGIIPNDGLHPGTDGYCGFVVSTKVRLWPRARGLAFRNEVHETVEQSAAESGLPFGRCDAVLHHFGGRALEEKDRLYAELGYEKARNDPCHRTYRELGLQLYRMGRPGEAVAALRRALEFQPKDAEGMVMLAASLFKLAGDDDAAAAAQAEETYLGALELDRDGELANRYYATFLNQRRRYKEAYWHYRRVAKRAKDVGDVKTLCDFAYACQHLAQPDEAAGLLERAAEVNPRYVAQTGMLECAYHMSGVLAGRSGDMAKAAERFRSALRLKPDFEEARHNLAVAEKWLATK
jgi:glycosyltransferase involved in cell wall biosynthesis